MIGIVLLLVSTAVQMFYLQPLDQEIQWRQTAFAIQQSAQIQLRTAYDNQIALLAQLNAPADKINSTTAAREAALASYRSSDADISDFIIAKEPVESTLQVLVLALFGLGGLLAGIGRALEMRAAPEQG